MRADEIRASVVEDFIDPAREAGEESVFILFKDVRSRIGPPRPDRTAIRGALTARKFLRAQNLDMEVNKYTSITFTILGPKPPEPAPPPVRAHASLRNQVAGLSQREFESLVRGYIQDKGFGNAEVTVTVTMKM